MGKGQAIGIPITLPRCIKYLSNLPLNPVSEQVPKVLKEQTLVTFQYNIFVQATAVEIFVHKIVARPSDAYMRQ